MTAPFLRIAALTHRGMVREHNEDVIAVNDWLHGGTMERPQRALVNLAQGATLLVCDGMGGHQAGEVASELAARTLSGALTGTPDAALAAKALQSVNEDIYRAATAAPDQAAMGTTIAGLWLAGQGLVWFNVGDSSVFRYANDLLVRLSEADTPDGARRGVVTQALGGATAFIPIEPHYGDLPVTGGARYLLCSDGLTDTVALAAIEAILAAQPAPADAVERLFAAACAAGAHDNVSIIVAATEDAPDDNVGEAGA